MEPDIVGFRFHPTREEIINHHLKRKLQMIRDEDRCVIPDVDIYQYDPGDLRAVYNEKSCRRSTSSHSYFFCPPKRSKTARGGFWRETSQKRVVEDEITGEVIGTKRFYAFCYGNRSNFCRSDWAMHEYHLNAADAERTIADPTAFVVCHIKKKDSKFAKANSKKQQSKSGDSPHGEGKGNSSASIDTAGVPEVIEAQKTNSEAIVSPSIMEGPQLLVLEPSPIISNAPHNEHDDVSNIVTLSDLLDNLGDIKKTRDAADCGKFPMESGAASAAMSIPLWYDYDTMQGAWGSEGNYAPNDANNDGFPLDENSVFWGWN